MGKREEYIVQLKPLINEGSYKELEDLLVLNSNLPGPRGNLELAYAFADCLETEQDNDKLLNLLWKWARISAKETPSDTPREFIPFCALQALCALFSNVDIKKKTEIVELLKVSANDLRWRIREAVAIGFQRIEEKDFREIEIIFSYWINEASLLEKRAIIATLAHPPVLNEKDNVKFCLQITEKILEDLIKTGKEFRKNEEFRVLRQGLEYAISVFVNKLPDQGFEFMKKWAIEDDPDIKKIIKSNLGKSRLTKEYGEQVNDVMAVLTGNSIR